MLKLANTVVILINPSPSNVKVKPSTLICASPIGFLREFIHRLPTTIVKLRYSAIKNSGGVFFSRYVLSMKQQKQGPRVKEYSFKVEFQEKLNT